MVPREAGNVPLKGCIKPASCAGLRVCSAGCNASQYVFGKFESEAKGKVGFCHIRI